MNQINLIRAEIERRKEIYEKTVDFARSTGQDECASININLANLCENLLSFLSSLEKECEEKPKPYFFCKHGGVISKCSDCKRNHSNSPYRAEEIQNWFVPSVRGTKQCSDYITIEKEEKPTTAEGLDVTDFCKPIDPGIAQCVADHLWEMLGEDEKPAPVDLEEAAQKFADMEYMVGDVDRSALYKGFWHGAKWQAEQDKETIELAEDHAYFAGTVNEKEKMIKGKED